MEGIHTEGITAHKRMIFLCATEQDAYQCATPLLLSGLLFRTDYSTTSQQLSWQQNGMPRKLVYNRKNLFVMVL